MSNVLNNKANKQENYISLCILRLKKCKKRTHKFIRKLQLRSPFQQLNLLAQTLHWFI